MMSIVDEIQSVSENADKCINYPIGEKLEAFIRHQDETNQTNFVLSGVLIYAAAKIFGRKVDYLEQEINGIAKNFAAVETTNEGEIQPEKELKKRRTKKFIIKDRVNLEKVSFDEKPIQALAKVDINKTLATPSKINRLQKIKEFFSKNKSKAGKLVIPKSLLFTCDYVVSNFGSTLIYDYDDNKDIVGSRRDFRSFSHYINSYTGELQNDINEFTTSANPKHDDDLLLSDRGNLSSRQSPVDWSAADDPEVETNLPEINLIPSTPEEDTTLQSINLFDEGIELDDIEKASMLLPTQPHVKLIDIIRKSPSLFPPDIQVNETIDMSDFNHSVLSVHDDLTNNVTDFDLPALLKEEGKIMNIFLIPLKKLKHRCIFELPNDEFGELKKRKREQFKASAPEPIIRQMRSFKPLDMSFANDSDDQPFLGFTKEQQEQSMTSFLLPSPKPREFNSDKTSQVELCRKNSNDSGYEIDISGECVGETTTDINQSLHNSSFDLGHLSSDDGPSFDTGDNSTILNSTDERKNSSLTESDHREPESNINISGGDSCYHSLMSGDSTKTDLSSFFKDIESRNNTINESEANDIRDESFDDSEQRVAQMQQSAVNIAKWKEYLKPILADSEARSKIDMHQYGVELIGKIGNLNDTTTFFDITEPGKTPAYFLTMLQLINNRNVEIDHGERSMSEPVDTKKIKIKLLSKVLHREKFAEMGQQFTLEEEKKVILKRSALQTSTPAKRSKIQPSTSSRSFNSLNASQSIIGEDMEQDTVVHSQASFGYFSQSSMLSDC